MLKTRKTYVIFSAIILLQVATVLAEDNHSESSYLSFPTGEPFMLRLFSVKDIFKKVSPDQRIALLYKESTLGDASIRLVTMGINSGTKLPQYTRQELSELIEMRYKDKSHSYEIKVTADTAKEASKLVKAITDAYVAACKQRADLAVERVRMALERELPYTIKELEKLREINANKDKKTLRTEMREKVLERKLFNLFKIKESLSFESDARSATGWYPSRTLR